MIKIPEHCLFKHNNSYLILYTELKNAKLLDDVLVGVGIMFERMTHTAKLLH